jgi:hypothetical protein
MGSRDPLDLLSNESLARINSEKNEARAKLLDRLSGFWDQIGTDFDALLTHDASELILVFQMYAEQRYHAYAKEFVAGAGGDSTEWSADVIDRLSNEIRPPRRSSPNGDLAPSLWHQLEPNVRVIKDGLLSVEDDGCFTCDWEICLTESFKDYRSKVNSNKQVKTLQSCEIIFRLKYRDYLRWYPTWMEFDRRLRAHLSKSGSARPQSAVTSVDHRVTVALDSIQPPTKQDQAAQPRTQRPCNPESMVEPVGGESEHVGFGSVPTSREERLQAFIVAHPGTTLADIKYSAGVHTPELQDWREDRLKQQSVMSRRIEDVLSGATRLKKKPRKPRPD